MAVDILADLNPQQREAVLHSDSPQLIVAGAGSGKTRVITHKIAYLVMQKGVAPCHILGVTFTNRAADEMKTRIEALTGIESRFFQLSTFHSFGLRILRESGGAFGFAADWKVIDDEEQKKLVAQIAKAEFPHFTSDQRDGVLRKINLAKMNMAYPNNPEPLRRLGIDDEEIAFFSAYYETQKRNCLWDYEDLISIPVRLLQEVDGVSRKYRERFLYILIDEFQDINPNQYELIKLIGAECKNITAVGDDDQAIYSWRGASVRFLFDYEKDFPGTRIVKLERNYRSSKRILAFANRLISFNLQRKGKMMWSESAEGMPVYLLNSSGKDDEAEKIAGLVAWLKKNSPQLFPLAVLYRINSQSLPLENAFLKRKIPFKIIKGLRFFERKEIKDCVALMRLVFNPDDDLAFLRLVDFLPLGIGEKTVAALSGHSSTQNLSLFRSLQKVFPEKFASQPLFSRILSFHEEKSRLQISQILTDLLAVSGYQRLLEQKEENERLLNIEELLDFIDKWQGENPDGAFPDLLDRMTLDAIGTAEEPSERVFFLTMHNAKGLEFQTVVAAGINAAYMPFFLSTGRQETEEERRLFYVACTRAMNLLVLSTGSARHSPFLLEIGSSLYQRVGTPEEVAPPVSAAGEIPEGEAPARFMVHPIFGKGRIVETISPDKMLVNFSDRGNKIIDTSVVRVEFL